MNQRVKKLRQQSVNTRPFICAERAELVTDFYMTGKALEVSAPMCRALAFKYIMENKTVCINPGELIVGERGQAPKATPTYPELCCHSLEDFAILESRERTPFAVSDQVKNVYADKVIPFWRGKTMREKVFAAMTPEWNRAFEAGVFTEFMEQRAPGHAILDDKIYKRGLADFKADIAQSLSALDYLNDPDAYDKSEQLKAMAICIDAVITFANRYADHAEQLAADESDSVRKAELHKIADICRRVPEHAPRTFHEALQSYWFVHLGVITELNTWDSYNPGRIDQHLWPFYKAENAAGTLDEEDAKELLGCFWVKFNNQPAPPKVGITEEQSGTYTDFALINVGGVDPVTGADAVNDLSYIVLDVVKDMQLVQPSSCIQISKKNPNRFLKRACEVAQTGLGQPSMFNTDVIIREMLHDGKNMVDARSGGPSGCVTISAFGRESCTLTGYCSWPKVLELTLNNGIDPRTGEQVGPRTGDAKNFGSFEQLMEAYRRQLAYFIDLKIAANNIIERLYANCMPSPFMSVLVDDCIKRGLDYHNGGPRYNTTYIQGVGIGSLTDSLAALKYHIYDNGAMTMDRMLELLASNFGGAEDVRRQLLDSTPKYGNDDEYADAIAEQVFEIYFEALDGRRNTKGGFYRVNLLPTTSHIYFGSVTGALPSGRKAGVPLSDGISPSQGTDTNGPTAVIKSAARIDHSRTGGTLLNMKFNPQVLEGEGIDKLCHLVRAYFKLDGHHIQFNVVDSQTLREAQKKPDEYRELIVRVAGYSDYFVDLGKHLQDEIIARTEQQAI